MLWRFIFFICRPRINSNYGRLVSASPPWRMAQIRLCFRSRLAPPLEQGQEPTFLSTRGGSSRFIRWHMQSQAAPSRLPIYHWQVLVDTLASPYKELLGAIGAASIISRSASAASERHEFTPAGGQTRRSLRVLTVSADSQDSRGLFSAIPASQALAARQTSGWKCQEVDFELGKVQEVEQNFRQVVILQSGSNNNNNNEFHWLKSIASVPISRSYIFKEKGCECRVTLGIVLIPGVLARLCCHVVLLDFELLIWKADRKPDTNETLNGTKEDYEEVHHWNKIIPSFRRPGTRLQYVENT